ncbi:BsuBI/PstI family type II restriction endonuclease [Pandoraea sp. PE-S2T-3]|uniref:BsuBI/PstI family type II restriction endonuclease n=1 Tax=Pandoraea sp. PE-S2T-3 TaxID=1986993 RepID=UPI000B3FB89E|nr:BsuBI/PstI family type II restriction endonuclease [Pandoraea sp. PE-S2T-3]
MSKEKKLQDALAILEDLGMPRPQLNERTALCLLALVNMTPTKIWADCEAPLIGITPIMDWAKEHYETAYAPNTRETFRRQSMHQFIGAGVCIYNPDKPNRPVNSPKAVYQIEPNLMGVLVHYGTDAYGDALDAYKAERMSLVEQYAKVREMQMVPVKVKEGYQITLSPGVHSELIREIVEGFGPRYAPGGDLVYVGDTGDKHGFFDKDLLASLGVELDNHGKLPDVVIYMRDKNWLLLIESVTSHGPVESKRQIELARLFSTCTAGLVYVSAFPDRKTFLKYLPAIAWESEVWIADAPTHMIHFNGSRFLGPYN